MYSGVSVGKGGREIRQVKVWAEEQSRGLCLWENQYTSLSLLLSYQHERRCWVPFSHQGENRLSWDSASLIILPMGQPQPHQRPLQEMRLLYGQAAAF